MLFATAHMAANGRYCCKSPKLTGDNFPARKRSKSRSLIDVVSISLPKSPVSLSLGDEVPHMFTRKAHLRLGKISISSAKRLLQQYLPLATKIVTQQIAALFDHLIGSEQHRRRD